MKGKLIVLEGLDGSGKATQTKLLCEKLSQTREITQISFPDYAQPSSTLVKMYLEGKFSSNLMDVNAYAATSFYAVDRYASYHQFWKKNYLAGQTIVADRYVSSNIIYQMTKLPQRDWEAYINWALDYEYEKLCLPQPDLTVYLDMPVEISQRFISARYAGDESKKDVHESNVEFLKKCRETALYSCKKLGWQVVNCAQNGSPKSVEEIHQIIFQLVKKVVF